MVLRCGQEGLQLISGPDSGGFTGVITGAFWIVRLDWRQLAVHHSNINTCRGNRRKTSSTTKPGEVLLTSMMTQRRAVRAVLSSAYRIVCHLPSLD